MKDVDRVLALFQLAISSKNEEEARAAALTGVRLMAKSQIRLLGHQSSLPETERLIADIKERRSQEETRGIAFGVCGTIAIIFLIKLIWVIWVATIG